MPSGGEGLRGVLGAQDVPEESGGSSLSGGLVGADGRALSAGLLESGWVGATVAGMGSAISGSAGMREGIFSGWRFQPGTATPVLTALQGIFSLPQPTRRCF